MEKDAARGMLMAWWELTLNPRVVLAYYTAPPELVGIEICSLQLHYGGCTLSMQAEFPQFPDKPSPRWPAEANAVRVGLRFLGLSEIAVSGWGTPNVGNLVLESVSGNIEFDFQDSSVQIKGAADFFDVTEIVGYIKRVED